MLEEINRHAVAPSDNFFTHMPFFVRKCKQMKDYVYEEILEDSIKIVWTEQCGYLEELRYLGKAALVCPG